MLVGRSEAPLPTNIYNSLLIHECYIHMLVLGTTVRFVHGCYISTRARTRTLDYNLIHTLTIMMLDTYPTICYL